MRGHITSGQIGARVERHFLVWFGSFSFSPNMVDKEKNTHFGAQNTIVLSFPALALDLASFTHTLEDSKKHIVSFSRINPMFRWLWFFFFCIFHESHFPLFLLCDLIAAWIGNREAPNPTWNHRTISTQKSVTWNF